MRVRIRCFAQLREQLGDSHVVDVAAGTTAQAAWRRVVAAHPAAGRIPVRFAVDEEYVGGRHRLRDGDELCVFPPVSGG